MNSLHSEKLIAITKNLLSLQNKWEISILTWKLSLATSLFYLAVAGGVMSVSSASSQNVPFFLAQTDVETLQEQTSEEINTSENPQPIDRNLENAIIKELNRVRTNPQEYAKWLESQKQYYDGMILKLPGEQPIRTNRGLRSLEEAIAFLRKQKPLVALSPATELVDNAQQQITAIVNRQTIKSQNSNLVYGKVTPEAIVMQLVVDDGFPDRRHRLAIFEQTYQKAGIACSEIAVYEQICAIAFTDEAIEIAESPSEEIATQPAIVEAEEIEETPEATVTENNNQLPQPPNLESPETNSDLETTESEVIVSTQTPTESDSDLETTDSPESDTESEVIVSTQTPTESDSDLETIDSPESDTESEVIVSTQTPPESDSDLETTDSPESDTESEVIVSTQTPPETDSELETTESEISQTPPETDSDSEIGEETAILSETNNATSAIEMIERGKLEEGDDVIPNDGSFYDSYPLEGAAGDSFSITLESNDFDTFLAVMDQNGNIIKQNDDFDEKDSNSSLEITLPDNGTYSIIVNAYDQGGKGEYVLKVRR